MREGASPFTETPTVFAFLRRRIVNIEAAMTSRAPWSTIQSMPSGSGRVTSLPTILVFNRPAARNGHPREFILATGGHWDGIAHSNQPARTADTSSMHNGPLAR